MLQEKVVGANESSWIGLLEVFLGNSHNLQLLDQVRTDGIVVDACRQRSFLRHDLELGDLESEGL